MKKFRQDNLIPILGLFTSIGTLLCCALPALLVTLGMGAALAGLVSHVPFLITLSEHKGWVFGVAGGLIFLSVLLQWTRRHAPCPVDPVAAQACKRLRRISIYMIVFAVGVYLTGVFFAFIAPKLFY